MKSFKEIHESKLNLKEYVRKIAKFTSWEFEGDYEELIISFSNASDTKKVYKKLTSGKDFDILDYCKRINANYKENTIELEGVKEKLFESRMDEKSSVNDSVYQALNLLEKAMKQTKNKKLKDDINKSYGPLVDIQARLETGGFYDE